MSGSPSFLTLIPGQGEGEGREEQTTGGVQRIFLFQTSNSLTGESCRRFIGHCGPKRTS